MFAASQKCGQPLIICNIYLKKYYHLNFSFHGLLHCTSRVYCYTVFSSPGRVDIAYRVIAILCDNPTSHRNGEREFAGSIPAACHCGIL